MGVLNLKWGKGLRPRHIREGDDVYFECQVDANPKVGTVEWYHGNRRVFDDKLNGILILNFSLVLQNTNLNHSGEYACRADNKVGKRTSNTLFLNIKQKIPLSTTTDTTPSTTTSLERVEIDIIRKNTGYYSKSKEVKEDMFVYGKLGSRVCSEGTPITDETSCRQACKPLNIPQATILGNAKCYKDGGNGRCYQDGQQ